MKPLCEASWGGGPKTTVLRTGDETEAPNGLWWSKRLQDCYPRIGWGRPPFLRLRSSLSIPENCRPIALEGVQQHTRDNQAEVGCKTYASSLLLCPAFGVIEATKYQF